VKVAGRYLTLSDTDPAQPALIRLPGIETISGPHNLAETLYPSQPPQLLDVQYISYLTENCMGRLEREWVSFMEYCMKLNHL
jgi:hypothetical protein